MRVLILTILCRDFQVVGAVCDGEQLVESAICLLPNVIVSDISMPQKDGLIARSTLIAQGKFSPFVFVSVNDKEVVRRLPKEPSTAFVYKGEMASHLGIAVETVRNGQHYRSPHYHE